MLAALVLVLLPVFTSTRETTLIALRNDPNAEKPDALRLAVITGILAFVSLIVFLAGLPLWFEVLGDLSPTSVAGVSRSLFAIVWPLLIGLIVWQISLVLSAWELRSKLP